MRKQNLKEYIKPKAYQRGKNFIIEGFWILIFKPIVGSFIPGSKWRTLILRFFGAKLGKSIRFNAGLKIKMPWKLSIGDHCWIGEETWIDNIANVDISKNVCISQAVYICTGNHNFKKSTFDLICKPITIEANVWVGAKSIITIGSIIKENIPKDSIFKNNKCFKL